MSLVRNRIQNYGYAGLIPFFGAAGTVWVLPEGLALTVSQAFITYACVILSFLGGVVWRPYLSGKNVGIENPSGEAAERLDSKAMDLGIAASLIAWALLLAMFTVELENLELILVVLSGVAFYVFRLVERQSAVLDYAPWFDELRDFLVRAVLASHFSIAVFLLQQ